MRVTLRRKAETGGGCLVELPQSRDELLRLADEILFLPNHAGAEIRAAGAEGVTGEGKDKRRYAQRLFLSNGAEIVMDNLGGVLRDNEVVYVTCGEDLAPQRVVLSVEAVLRERSTDGSGGAGEGGLAQPQGNGQRRGADGAAAGSNACVDAANGTARVRAAGGGGAGGGGAGGAVSDQPRPAVGALVAATVSLAPFPEQKQADDAVSSVGRSGSPHAPKAATPSGDGAGSQNTVSCGNCQGRGRIDGFYAQFCVFYEARTNAAPRCVCSVPPCLDTPASLATIGLLTFCLPCWLLTCCVCGEAVPLVKKKCKRCRGSGAVAWDAKLARFVPAFPEASEGIKPMESERG